MQISKPFVALTSLLPSSATLLKLARLSRFVLRTPQKIFPDQLLRSVLLALCENTPHFRAVAENISSLKTHDPSRQAVFERLGNEAAPGFFSCAFRQVLAEQSKRFTDIALGSSLERAEAIFCRIIIEDGSVLALHKSLVESFRGAANQFGESAALRLRWAFDFLTGQTIDAELHHWRDNDMSTAFELIDHLEAGDLVLRDMGYFCLECLNRIAAKGAFFLTRLPEGTAITVIGDGGAERISLPGLLRRTEAGVAEWRVEIGESRQVPGRLVAARIDPDKAAQRRRKLREKCREQGRQPSQDQLRMCDWVAVFTNVESDQLEAEAVAQLYRARWMVEIFFKGMKSAQSLESWSAHRTNEHTIQCLAYAQMIIGVLSLNLWRVLGQILLQNASERAGDPGGKPSHQLAAAAGPIKSFEMLLPILGKVFAGQLPGRALGDELRRTARYVKQEKRNRLSLDAFVFGLLA